MNYHSLGGNVLFSYFSDPTVVISETDDVKAGRSKTKKGNNEKLINGVIQMNARLHLIRAKGQKVTTMGVYFPVVTLTKRQLPQTFFFFHNFSKRLTLRTYASRHWKKCSTPLGTAKTSFATKCFQSRRQSCRGDHYKFGQ